ncbi:uncharacterized protein M6B38_387160 [Iris pallida]|uniref:Uncharacterized protein n=1 Tax=Iris pallida TaxID=29817 RepID=A0AAX6G3F8_IRIPA|nr:uncharacterized protein M6B38_387160 [Iris pallida]
MTGVESVGTVGRKGGCGGALKLWEGRSGAGEAFVGPVSAAVAGTLTRQPSSISAVKNWCLATLEGGGARFSRVGGMPRRFSVPLLKSKHGAGRDALAMDSKARPGTMAQETLGDGGRRLRSRRRMHTRSARWRSQMSDFGGAGIEFGNCGGGDDGSGDGQR